MPFFYTTYGDKTTFVTVYESITEDLLEDRLGGEHGAVDLQDLLLLDEVLPPGLQDIVLKGTAHRAEVVQAAHTWGALLHGNRMLKHYVF